MTLVIAFTLVVLSGWLVWHIAKNTKLIFIHLLLLLATPWFLTLILAHPSLSPLPASQPNYDRISSNLSFLTSDDFLFFRGDGRPGYGTGDHGVFLLSFLPFILMGVYHLAKSQTLSAKLPFWWLLSGLTIAVVFGRVSGLPAALWYLPALSTVATVGVNKALEIITSISTIRSKESTTPTLQSVGVVPVLLVANFLWVVYEAIRLYHVIIVHQPFAK